MKKNTILVLILIVALVAVGIYIYNNREQTPVSPGNGEETVSTTVYFSDESYGYLIARDVTVKKADDGVYKAVLNKLIKGPEEEGLYPPVNSKTVVNSVSLKDGVATVDFSDTFIRYNTGGSSRETMCIYSIVNTLCEFSGIEKVAFTVDGKKIETFGQLDMTEPYEKDLSIVK